MPEGMGEVDAESVAESHKTTSYGRRSYKKVPIRKYLTVGYPTGEYPIKFPIKEYPTGVLHIQRSRILLLDSKLKISSFHKEPTNMMIWNTGLETLPRLFRYL